MSKAKKTKPYWEMTLNELREATKEFDKPIPASRMRPLTKTERGRFERARQAGVRSIYLRRRRPKSVTLQLDEGVISTLSDYATQHKVSLSEMVERSLRSTITFIQST